MICVYTPTHTLILLAKISLCCVFYNHITLCKFSRLVSKFTRSSCSKKPKLGRSIWILIRMGIKPGRWQFFHSPAFFYLSFFIWIAPFFLTSKVPRKTKQHRQNPCAAVSWLMQSICPPCSSSSNISVTRHLWSWETFDSGSKCSELGQSLGFSPLPLWLTHGFGMSQEILHMRVPDKLSILGSCFPSTLWRANILLSVEETRRHDSDWQ